jgi:hypothetical protein
VTTSTLEAAELNEKTDAVPFTPALRDPTVLDAQNLDPFE